MFNDDNFIDEVKENIFYALHIILFHTILLEEAQKIDINKYDRDLFFENVRIKYWNTLYRSQLLHDFEKTTKSRCNNLRFYLSFLSDNRFHVNPSFNTLVKTMLDHRENIKPSTLGLNLSSKKFCPVLWGNTPNMESFLKRSYLYYNNKHWFFYKFWFNSNCLI